MGANTTNVGSRVSERDDISPERASRLAQKHSGNPEESRDFHGYKTCIVPMDDPADKLNLSPVGKFKGLGYEELSRDPMYTGHAGHVLMGIPIEKYTERETARIAGNNSPFIEGYAPDVASSLGEKDPLQYLKGMSGVRKGPAMKLPVHSGIAGLIPSDPPSPG